MPITLVSFSLCTAERINRKSFYLYINFFFAPQPVLILLVFSYSFFVCPSPSRLLSSLFSFRGKSAPPLRTYKGPWHLISCLWCSFTLFLCVILALLHLYPSPSHSHSFLLFFFVISLLSAHNPWFYLQLLPSEHYGSFCKEISSFLALHLQTFQIWSEHSVLVSWCCNCRQLTRFWNTLSLEVCLWGVLLIKEMCLIWQLTWCENLWHFSVCVWLLEWDKWPCLCLREQVAKSAWWPATHTYTRSHTETSNKLRQFV